MLVLHLIAGPTMTNKTTSTIGMAIIRFLQRDGAKETWWYERTPILFVELLCLLAGILAAPNRAAALLLVVDLPRSLLSAEFGRSARSASARKVEMAEAMGIPAVELRCQRDIDNTAKNQQLMTAAAPVVALAMSVAASGGAGLSLAAAVGFAVSLVRYGMVEGYSPWRKWYRRQVPCRVKEPKALIVPSRIDYIVGLLERVSDERIAAPSSVQPAELAELVIKRLQKMADAMPQNGKWRRLSAADEYEIWRPTEGRLTECLQSAFDEYGDNARVCARAIEDFLRECAKRFTGHPPIGDEELYRAAELREALAVRNRDLVQIAEAVKLLPGKTEMQTKVPSKLAVGIIMRVNESRGIRIGAAHTLPAASQHLAETTPFQSDAIAKAAEEVLREARSTGETEQ
jgi:hypothetical protein